MTVQRTEKPLLSAVDDLHICCPLVNDGRKYKLRVFPRYMTL